jgi:hypothetical protein
MHDLCGILLKTPSTKNLSKKIINLIFRKLKLDGFQQLWRTRTSTKKIPKNQTKQKLKFFQFCIQNISIKKQKVL